VGAFLFALQIGSRRRHPLLSQPRSPQDCRAVRPILWLDPTRKTAARFSRGELQPFIKGCNAVAALAVVSKTTWTTLEMQFRACALRIIGSGSAAELGGFQAEMVVRNERDKLRIEFARESSSADLAEARTKHLSTRGSFSTTRRQRWTTAQRSRSP
jgi:phage terminase large subunit GpA-like protein